MGQGQIIKLIKAREVYSLRGHPGVETTVVTQNEAVGVAVATAGTSVGGQEASFLYDDDRLEGYGVGRAVNNVNDIIAPALIGMDASRQLEIDNLLLELDGTPDKSKLGANATGSVSAAVLKAGASSLGIPLYQHIGGVNACTLPVPGIQTIMGAHRYGGGKKAGSKPTYSIMCYGFDSFREASWAGWRTIGEFIRLLNKRLGTHFLVGDKLIINSPIVKNDGIFWEIMTETITNLGYEGRMGIQVDVAAGTYYDYESEKYIGLFSAEDKSKNDLMELYQRMVKEYPFVILEDPLEEDDFDGHAFLTKELGIQVVGDDVFATNLERLKLGVKKGACNTVLLKVNQIGTISEAFKLVEYAQRNNYRVMPCSSRGEGKDIADYAVGLGTGQIREGAIDQTGNRLLEIEEQLRKVAEFPNKAGRKMGVIR